MKTYYILIVLFLSINLNAQEISPLLERVQEVQSELNRDFILIENLFIPNDLVSVTSDRFRDSESVRYFDYNNNLYNRLLNNQDKAIALQIPSLDEKGSHLVLDLIEVSESFYDYTVTTSSGVVYNGHDLEAVHYRGIVRNQEANSLVALSVFENEISGIISISGQGTINIGKLANQNQHIIYNDSNLSSRADEECHTPENGDQNPILDDIYSNVYDETQGDLLSTCLKMYFEVDHDIYNFLGSSTSNTNSFISGMFNEVATIFLNESISMEISEIFIWDTPDNYSTSTSSGLSQFVALRPSFNGDLAHLLTFRSGSSNPNNLSNAGGIANRFGGVCVSGNVNLSPHSHTRIFPDFEAFPVFSRQVKVIAHEIGHNLGCRHTHACVWNENDTAIDGCSGRTEGSCPVPPPMLNNTGTIMSYCDRNIGIDFTLGFGPQPGNLIRNFVSNLTCVDMCNPTNCALSTNTTNITLNENAANASFSVFSDSDWTVSDNASWLSLATINGMNNGTVSFNVSANVTTDQRTAIITVMCNGTTVNVIVVQNEGGVSSPGCRYTDSLALVSLYNSTDGPNWINTWNLNEPMNNWHGIHLNTSGCVIWLSLFQNGLNGNIPEEIGHLTELTYLWFGEDPISGTIPSGIGNLTKLTDLRIHSTSISGEIPTGIGNITNLKHLWLHNNNLSGVIPIDLSNLANVTMLWLQDNNLSGNVPSGFGNLINVSSLNLADNQLGGSIPSTLGNLSNLTNLNIAYNNFSGSIPTQLGNLNNLSALSLQSNALTGSIPSELGNLSNLTYMGLRNNNLSGSIPKELGNLSNLLSLFLNGNNLSDCYDANLTILCSQLSSSFNSNTYISNGNNFDAPWEDFCNTGAGSCSSMNMITNFPYSQGFESGLGLWAQDSDDDFNWTRKSGSTPSSGTGPSGAAAGTYYMYTEASGNNNKVASLVSPLFDLSQVAEPVLDFKLHVLGNDLGSIGVEISTDFGASWNSLIGLNFSGWGGINNWLTLSLPTALSSYSSEVVQLRFIGTTGNGYSCDMAIDDITVSSNLNGNSDDCPESLSVNDPVLLNSQFSALNHASASDYILSGTYVSISAGKDVELLSGFEVEQGAVFHAYIGACQ